LKVPSNPAVTPNARVLLNRPLCSRGAQDLLRPTKTFWNEKIEFPLPDRGWDVGDRCDFQVSQSSLFWGNHAGVKAILRMRNLFVYVSTRTLHFLLSILVVPLKSARPHVKPFLTCEVAGRSLFISLQNLINPRLFVAYPKKLLRPCRLALQKVGSPSFSFLSTCQMFGTRTFYLRYYSFIENRRKFFRR